MHATCANFGLQLHIGVAMRETAHGVKQARVVSLGLLIRVFIEFHRCCREQVPIILLLLLIRIVFIDILIKVRLRLAILQCRFLPKGEVLLASIVNLMLIAYTIHH